MYSGELEVQTKRKTIPILQEETNKILNLSRELAFMTDALFLDNKDGIKESSYRMSSLENDIMVLRKQITKEVMAIGSLMTYREDLLRTAYFVDEILVILVESPLECRTSNRKSSNKILN